MAALCYLPRHRLSCVKSATARSKHRPFRMADSIVPNVLCRGIRLTPSAESGQIGPSHATQLWPQENPRDEAGWRGGQASHRDGAAERAMSAIYSSTPIQRQDGWGTQTFGWMRKNKRRAVCLNGSFICGPGLAEKLFGESRLDLLRSNIGGPLHSNSV